MKRKIIAIILLLSFSMSFAKNIADTKILKDSTTPKSDVIVLVNGEHLKGEIVKMTKNAFVLLNENNEKVKIKNDDVLLVGFAQEISAYEKYQLGLLDGKRANKKRDFGNALVGVLLGIIGAGIVYISSNKIPFEADVLPENVKLINDFNYQQGFKKGAKKQAGNAALVGTLVGIVISYLIPPIIITVN